MVLRNAVTGLARDFSKNFAGCNLAATITSVSPNYEKLMQYPTFNRRAAGESFLSNC